MNTLKYFIILVFALSFNKGQGQDQNINYLTPNEFNAIKINGVRFDAIEKTKGDRNQMKNLFGDGFKVTEGDKGSGWILTFSNNSKDFGISFIDYEISSNRDYFLYSFDVNRPSNITIKGLTVSVGDPISKLGNVKFIGNEIYFDNELTSDSHSLVIEVHPYFKTILSIRYITFD